MHERSRLQRTAVSSCYNDLQWNTDRRLMASEFWQILRHLRRDRASFEARQKFDCDASCMGVNTTRHDQYHALVVLDKSWIFQSLKNNRCRSIRHKKASNPSQQKKSYIIFFSAPKATPHSREFLILVAPWAKLKRAVRPGLINRSLDYFLHLRDHCIPVTPGVTRGRVTGRTRSCNRDISIGSCGVTGPRVNGVPEIKFKLWKSLWYYVHDNVLDNAQQRSGYLMVADPVELPRQISVEDRHKSAIAAERPLNKMYMGFPKRAMRCGEASNVLTPCRLHAFRVEAPAERRDN